MPETKRRSVEKPKWTFLENCMLPSQGCCEDQSENVCDLSLKILKAFRNGRDHYYLHTKNKTLSSLPKTIPANTKSMGRQGLWFIVFLFIVSDFRVSVGLLVVNICFTGIA